MKDSRTLQELLRFVLVGIIATAIHYSIYYLLKTVFPYSIAYTIGYIISFLLNFYLTARYTFRAKRSVKNGLGFCFAHATNYLIQIILLRTFIHYGVSETMAPLPVYIIAVPVNFVLVRFVFRKML